MNNKEKKNKKTKEQYLKWLTRLGEKFSKENRSKATKWELQLMRMLRKTNYKFKFQYPIICSESKLYILDFYFPELNCSIEIQSKQHHTSKEDVKKDKRKKKLLRKEGIEVLYLWNMQVATMKQETLLKVMEIAELTHSEKLKDANNTTGI